MRIKENLGGIVRATGNIPLSTPNSKPQIGKVYGVVLDEITPTNALFNKAGGWSGIGSVYYLEYSAGKNLDTVNLNECKIARPLQSHIQNYPLIGELILLTDAPTPTSQTSNTSNQKYYISIVNVWNSNQQNSPSGEFLGKTFTENADARNLRTFEGDIIYQGRKGSGLRFGSTTKLHSNANEWSTVGNDGDPITILTNGYVTKDTKSLTPIVEKINEELSAAYFTSTQILPLQPGASIVNPRVNTILPKDYKSSQVILNGDRITLNAKKDEVLLFAKGNIELNSDNIININAGRVSHINSPSINLGTKPDGSYPDEPLLLGNKTKELLKQLLSVLSTLGNDLKSVVTPISGSPLAGVNVAGVKLASSIKTMQDLLKDIASTNNFTV